MAEAAPLPGLSSESLEHVIERAVRDRDRFPDWIQGLQPVQEPLPASLAFALSALQLDHQEHPAAANPEATQPSSHSPSHLEQSATRALQINGVIGAVSAEELEEAIRLHVRAGYTTVKVKLTAEPESHIRTLRTLTGAYPHLRLRLDANRCWSWSEAVEWLGELRTIQPEYCEEPLTHPSLDELDELQQATGIPLALDESLDHPDRIRDALQRDHLDTFILKASRLGDLQRIATTLASARRPIRAIWTTSLESAVGRATLCRAAAAWGTPGLAHGLDTGSLFQYDVLQTGRTPDTGPERSRDATRHWVLSGSDLDFSRLERIE